MQRSGFTIVEIIITITIMGILLTLTVVSLSNNQMRSRDEERKADIESIALHLESYYNDGNDATGSGNFIARYPHSAFLATEASIKLFLPDADSKIFIAPGATSITSSLIPATNAVQSASGVAPAPTIDQYVYQPINSNGALCQTTLDECRKFNLFYRLEGDETVYMVTSKNQ